MTGVLLAMSGAALLAPSAEAADGPSTVAEALQKGPVYVDPGAVGQFPRSEAEALAQKIKDADKPLFVAVLPSTPEFPQNDRLLNSIRAQTGESGVYAIQVGDEFGAKADGTALPPGSVNNLAAAARAGSPGDASAQLNTFVDRALPMTRGDAPASWGNTGAEPGRGGIATGLVVLGALVVVAGGSAFVLTRRTRTRQAERERAALDKLRVVVDEDITAFGEELDRLDFHPAEPGADDAMRTDYEHALDAYEEAKSRMASAQRPDDVRPVTKALEDGRFSLATLDARRKGTPLPERRPPCFFDPRHGPSVD